MAFESNYPVAKLGDSMDFLYVLLGIVIAVDGARFLVGGGVAYLTAAIMA